MMLMVEVERQQYNLINSLVNQNKTILDENGNPVNVSELDINPWTDGQGDNPLIDMYLTDTLAAQYADKYDDKKLVQ